MKNYQWSLAEEHRGADVSATTVPCRVDTLVLLLGLTSWRKPCAEACAPIVGELGERHLPRLRWLAVCIPGESFVHHSRPGPAGRRVGDVVSDEGFRGGK